MNIIKHIIAKSLFCAFDNAFQDLTKSEPQLVASMLFYVTQEINKISCNHFNIKAGGVFVHQKPLVTSVEFLKTSPKNVEIGDVLLLRTETDKQNNVVSRSALLLQAKKTKNIPTTSPDNKNQHSLYEKWPKFSYQRASKLNGEIRHITGMDLYAGAQYLLIFDNHQATNKFPSCHLCLHPFSEYFRDCQDYKDFRDCYKEWREFHYHRYCCKGGLFSAHPTKPFLSHYRCFIRELTEFIMGNAGKTYQYPPEKRTIGWDKVIEDLITITSNISLSKTIKKVIPEAETRGQGIKFFFCGENSEKMMLGKIKDFNKKIFNDGENNEPPKIPEIEESNDDDSDGGISIIEFQVSSNNDL